jgi:hypothetical protein
MGDRNQHHADNAYGDRRDSAEAGALAEKDQSEQGCLRRLGSGVGRADGEIAKREQMDEQESGSDLTERAEKRPGEEFRVHRRQRITDDVIEHPDEEQREGKAETEAHESRPGRAHHGLQVLLRRRAQILQKCSGDGDGDPEFHGRLSGEAGS